MTKIIKAVVNSRIDCQAMNIETENIDYSSRNYKLTFEGTERYFDQFAIRCFKDQSTWAPTRFLNYSARLIHEGTTDYLYQYRFSKMNDFLSKYKWADFIESNQSFITKGLLVIKTPFDFFSARSSSKIISELLKSRLCWLNVYIDFLNFEKIYLRNSVGNHLPSCFWVDFNEKALRKSEELSRETRNALIKSVVVLEDYCKKLKLELLDDLVHFDKRNDYKGRCQDIKYAFNDSLKLIHHGFAI